MVLKIEVLDYDPTFADVAIGVGCEEIILTFRKTPKGKIRKTAGRIPEHSEASTTYVPPHAFREAHDKAVEKILEARREAKDPHFLKRKFGER